MKKHIENTIENPVTANSVRDNNDDNIIDGGVCYWVTGHSMGAGVANLVAASLISSEAIQDIRALEGNSDNVYCYTFASPNTFYKTDNRYIRDSHAIPGKYVTGDYREPKGVKYRCIFNIVNDDDFVPKLPMEECEWTRYGRVGNKSVKIEYPKNFEKLHIRTTLSAGYNPITTNYKLYHFLTTYKGDPSNPTDISKAFSEIFNDKNNMRNESYVISDELITKLIGFENTNVDKQLFRWSLPFQTKELLRIYAPEVSSQYYLQKLSPQYLFSCVGEMMHEYSDYISDNGEKEKVDNKFRFFTIELPPKLYKARKSLLSIIPLKLTGLYIQDPHYLESYYTLTKIVSTVDFK